MKQFSVAIDGPSGAGKSTMARLAAQQLGLHYVDTGAIYRTVGYFVRQRGVSRQDGETVTRLLDEVKISMHFPGDGLQHMLLNGQDVTGEIRTPEIAQYASGVAAIPAVRAFLLEMQRDAARHYNVIMDGRDIGTVVLPDADVKIFLTASAEERARRRYTELLEKGQKAELSQVLEDMRRRDEADANRAVAPLRQAQDAVVVDTTGMTIEQNAAAIVNIIREKWGK